MYVFGISCVFAVLVSLTWSHNTRRGFHLSNSCRPVCRLGLTCVTFRDLNGFPKQDCILLDPHTYRLDGTLVVPLDQYNGNNNQVHHYLNANSAEMLPESRLPERNRTLPPATMEDVVHSKQKLVNTISRLPQSLRHELLNQLQRFSAGVSENKGQIEGQVNIGGTASEHVGTVERDSGETQQNSFGNLAETTRNVQRRGRGNDRPDSSLSASRATDRNLENRGKGQQRNSTGSSTETGDAVERNVRGRLRVPTLQDIFSRSRSRANETSEARPSETSRERHSNKDVDQTSLNTPDPSKETVCLQCDPDQGCPPGEYCYFSPACAYSICQPL